MTHHANRRFWQCYGQLLIDVRTIAERNYALLEANPKQRSLHFKKIGSLWSVRVGLHHRALATEAGEDLVWFWIGSHAAYDNLVGRRPAIKALQPTSRRPRPMKKKSARG